MTHAFLPAKAHVSQNPIFVVIKVDLASWREERVSQFSCDAIKTMVQIRLQTVRVVDGIEACQDRKRDTYLRAKEENPHSNVSAPWRLQQRDDELQKTEVLLQSLSCRLTNICLTVSKNLCRMLEFYPKGQVNHNFKYLIVGLCV